MKLNLVPARSGIDWIKEGARTFFRNPLALSSTFILFMIVMTVLSALSLVGSIIALVLLPCGMLTMMSATRLVSESSLPVPGVIGHALADIRGSVRALLLLGLLYAAGYLLILGISYLIDGGTLARVMLVGERLTPELLEQPGFAAATWVTALLSIPLSLMFWHAPGLLHWYQVPPAKALFFSLVACLRNWRAYAVFVLGWVALLLALNVAVVVLGLLLSSVGGGAVVATVLRIVSSATMLIAAAVFLCSSYFPLRDSFIPS
ncbi:MAG: BPSS1780 family membrane protein [Comamonas sp.]